ncbi:MAG: response regulator [Negativicutes bacterium]|nr:response regulator [Negativicutes bacterium]
MARILIVDDSFVMRKTLGKILTELGHTVAAEAADGAQAFAEYTYHRPDIVTMDLTMKGESGAEATSKIVATFPDAKIIVISASEERKVILDALERGARHYIIKPITSGKISAVLDNVLHQEFDHSEYRKLARNLKEADGNAGEIRSSLAEGEKNRMARILIVDDSAVARKSLREIVTSLGHTVAAEAANGAQAFVEFTHCKPDIVTMDLTMQGMSGAEATSKIIATFPEAKIIVISAIEERRVVVDALERGARHFIIKPINQEKVAAVLNNVLQQKFDHDKHMALVRKLKGSDDPTSLSGAAPEYLPPYQISLDNKLILVAVNSSLTLTSCRSLAIELEEYLTGTPRVLFDFGTTEKLDQAVLAEIDKMIQTIENKSGMVKAASRSPLLADFITMEGNVPSLAAVLRYFSG